jgi:hypothetical protein
MKLILESFGLLMKLGDDLAQGTGFKIIGNGNGEIMTNVTCGEVH